MIKRVFIFLSVILLGYFIGAFCSWSANPGEWSTLGRLMIGVCTPAIAAVLTFAPEFNNT